VADHGAGARTGGHGAAGDRADVRARRNVATLSAERTIREPCRFTSPWPTLNVHGVPARPRSPMHSRLSRCSSPSCCSGCSTKRTCMRSPLRRPAPAVAGANGAASHGRHHVCRLRVVAVVRAHWQTAAATPLDRRRLRSADRRRTLGRASPPAFYLSRAPPLRSSRVAKIRRPS
jgi:hypothetical protein